MSRIGNRVLSIPANVSVAVQAGKVVVKGKDELTIAYPVDLINVVVENNTIKVSRNNDEKQTKMYHGTVNANINNALKGVTDG